MIKISVVTPSFNHGRFIEETIMSVLNQRYDNFEHIIIDGGSTDNTLDILKKYPHLNWSSEKDRGQAHAINKALKIATGDVIAWINADDMYYENTFHNINNILQNNKDIHFFTGSIYLVDINGKIKKAVNAFKLNKKQLLNGNSTVIQPGTFFSRIVVKKIGLLNADLRFCMDYEYFIRILSKYEHYFFPNKFFAYYRDYEFTKTKSSKLEFYKEILDTKKKYNASMYSLKNIILQIAILKNKIF